MGIWEVRIEHRKSPRSKKFNCIAFMMNDVDEQNGLMPKAFEQAMNAIKRHIENGGDKEIL